MRKHIPGFLAVSCSALLLASLGIATAQEGEETLNVEALLPTSTGEEATSAPTGETTAETSGDVTVGELQSYLNFPLTVRIKEYQEDLANPPSIFDDESTVKRIFGDKPRFIYYPDGVDPMIIPWVRQAIIAEELLEEATISTANRDYDKALDTLRKIREDFAGTETADKVPAEMKRVEDLKRKAFEDATRATGPGVGPTPSTGPEDNEVDLPEWVRTNTTAILIADRPVVVVGNDFLEVGAPVPRYPSVRVKSIVPSEVVFVYQNKEFPLEVLGTF